MGPSANIVSNATVLYGWWPRLMRKNDYRQPKMAPFCKGTLEKDLALPWTGCQSWRVMQTSSNVFSFSPGLSKNFTNQSVDTVDSNPFDQWLLCGINGSCTDLTPMVMIGGGRAEKG